MTTPPAVWHTLPYLFTPKRTFGYNWHRPDVLPVLPTQQYEDSEGNSGPLIVTGSVVPFLDVT